MTDTYVLDICQSGERTAGADVRVGDRCGKMLPEFKLSARQRESGVKPLVKDFWEGLNDEQ